MANNKYFYHGFDFNVGYESIMFLRNFLRSGKICCRLGMICLYQKNDDFDYNNKDLFFKSARSGWIDGCVVFVINPDIEAKKFEYEDSLVDEWRTYEDIDFSKVVGICIPSNFFNCSKKYERPEDIVKAKGAEKEIKEIIKSYGWFVANSMTNNFTDKLDNSLKQEKTLKKINK